MGYTSIRPRRGTASEWSTANPILWEGEWGLVKPEQSDKLKIWKFKIGDGVTKWNDLPWAIMNSIKDLGKVTVKSSNFSTTTEYAPPEFPYRASISNSKITETSKLYFMETQDTHNSVRLSTEYACFNGGVYIYADQAPTKDVVFNNIQIREANTMEANL